MKRNLTIALLVVSVLAGLSQMSEHVVSAQQKLTLAMVLTGLQTQGKTEETNTLAKRNTFIANRVRQNGVTFRLTPEIEKELRNAGATTALIETIRRYGPAPSNTPTPTPPPATRASAVLKETWFDYDVTEAGKIGLRIHVNFSLNGMRGVPAYVAVYFKDTATGRYLMDKNNSTTYRSGAGEVAVYREIDPCCNVTDYADLTIFMPYDEFDLTAGKYDLVADIKVIYKSGGVVSALTEKAFTYTKSAPKNESNAKATVKRVWIDYNITQNNRKGMRVHTNFEVAGLKNVGSKLTYRIVKPDNSFIPSRTELYSNDENEFQVEFAMNPAYDPAVFADAIVFIPYDEIVVSRGRWDLKIDIDLAYEDGTIISHLHLEPFTFTQP